MESMPGKLSCIHCGAELHEPSDICPQCVTAPSPERVTAEASGFDLPGFRLERVLGAGGMGVVYVAEEQALGRRVAIKTIQTERAPSREWAERFEREARLMATVEDPNVVRVYSSIENGGRRFIVMEYVEGESLAERLKREKRLPLEIALRVSLQVAFGLRAAAEKGVVHRDIKPGNILIDVRDNVRVTDFGLSRSIGIQQRSQVTQEGLFVGTPTYVSPEQAAGTTVGVQADMYSLGIVLFEMLAGEAPFRGATPLAVVAKHLHEPIPRLAAVRRDLPSSIQKFVEKMTQKNPALRFESWDEVIGEIHGLMRSFAPPINLEGYSTARFTAGATILSVFTGVLVALSLLMTVGLFLLALNLGVARVFGDPGHRWMQEHLLVWMPVSLLVAGGCTAALVGIAVRTVRHVARWRI